MVPKVTEIEPRLERSGTFSQFTEPSRTTDGRFRNSPETKPWVESLPFGEEVPGGVEQQEELLLRLAAVPCVQEVLEWHRPLGRADHVDVLLLDAPGPTHAHTHARTHTHAQEGRV